MSLKNVNPGRYPAKVKDWGVDQVAKLNDALKAVVMFDFKDEAGGWHTIKWDGFIEKTDGSINKKTTDTLKLCGMNGNFLDLLQGGPGLDMTKDLEITIERDGEYMRVEWVNDPAGSFTVSKEGTPDLVKRLKGLSLKAGLKAAGPKIRNHAPGAEQDVNPELGF